MDGACGRGIVSLPLWLASAQPDKPEFLAQNDRPRIAVTLSCLICPRSDNQPTYDSIVCRGARDRRLR